MLSLNFKIAKFELEEPQKRGKYLMKFNVGLNSLFVLQRKLPNHLRKIELNFHLDFRNAYLIIVFYIISIKQFTLGF